MSFPPYHGIWRQANGPAPWPCFGCGEDVAELGSMSRTHWRDWGVIHHHDGDHSNNALANLRVMHHSCHGRHHNRHDVEPIHASIDLTIARPLCWQIADQLRAKIQASEITDRLPTIWALMDEITPRPGYNTVRKAIGVLVKEGLVETSPRGTFLRKDA